ncbi:MAG: hypothetical protein HOE90_14630 [Bacteriovoracaceae bacterium]|jgi:hypothetical protein|nr:hypothetical protein [Bacteriovoracaceae bacterium]
MIRPLYLLYFLYISFLITGKTIVHGPDGILEWIDIPLSYLALFGLYLHVFKIRSKKIAFWKFYSLTFPIWDIGINTYFHFQKYGSISLNKYIYGLTTAFPLYVGVVLYSFSTRKVSMPLKEESSLKKKTATKQRGMKKNESIFISTLVLCGVCLFFYAQFSKKARANLNDLTVGVFKPVIYLYPQQETKIRAKLDFDGQFHFTWPPYHEGWEVVADPNGKIQTMDGNEYSYLFWDGLFNLPDMWKEDGTVVEGNKLDVYLRKTMINMGLKPTEYNELIVFWTPILKKSPYVQVTILTDEYEKMVPLHIEPKPDNILRLYILFRKLDERIEVKAQKLPTLIREGFTVVEWGGSIIKDDRPGGIFQLIHQY